MTTFRYLKQVPYRRSYNHNGRYYCLHEPTRYDRLGLWSFRGIHFSVDGSLRNTVARMVREDEAGATHHELQDRLRVRAHNTLLDLVRKREVARERVADVYLYLHTDPVIQREQIHQRRERTATEQRARARDASELSDQVIIAVLLALIRHPGSGPADVLRHLRGHAPPIPFDEIRAVFNRYDLGEKGGSSIY